MIGKSGQDDNIDLTNKSIGNIKLLAFSEAIKTMENRLVTFIGLKNNRVKTEGAVPIIKNLKEVQNLDLGAN